MKQPGTRHGLFKVSRSREKAMAFTRSGLVGSRLNRGRIGQEAELSLTDMRDPDPITLKGVMGLVVAFLVFKAGVMAWFGLELYAASISVMQDGNVLQKAAAVIMRPDAFSQGLSAQIISILS